MQTQITSLCRDIKKLQTDSVAPPPQSLAQAAVHTENFITSVSAYISAAQSVLKSDFLAHTIAFYMYSALVNTYKAKKSPTAQHNGVAAFYLVVTYVCDDTLRHPPTRQFLSSCVEILGQVHTCPGTFRTSLCGQTCLSQVHVPVFLQFLFICCA